MLPEKFANAPSLLPGLELFYLAFHDLTTCRGEGQIPWTAIREWANEHGLDGEQREDLFFHVRSMDRVFLDWRAAQRKG